jgi:hypothetical protein
MTRPRCVLPAIAIAATIALPLAGGGAQAPHRPPPRFELTPFGGYHWGGSLDTDAGGGLPSGELQEKSSFSWGIAMSFLAAGASAAELIYLRQDTDVRFDPSAGDTRDVSAFANNYVLFGGRQEFPRPSGLNAFVTAAAGINILQPKSNDLGSTTRFAWSLGGGAKFLKPGQRVGARFDMRWLVTPVPSGEWGTWCDAWGCFSSSGTAWLNQGHASGGLVVSF